MKKPNLVPLFGCRPHVPARCGETPEHMKQYLPKRRKGSKGKAEPKPPCDLCRGDVLDRYPFICMDCLRAGKSHTAAIQAHDLGSLPYDRRLGEPKPAKVAKVKPPRLTMAERADLAAELASEGIDADPEAAAFLASLAMSAV